jgi:hypothetical protein
LAGTNATRVTHGSLADRQFRKHLTEYNQVVAEIKDNKNLIRLNKLSLFVVLIGQAGPKVRPITFFWAARVYIAA